MTSRPVRSWVIFGACAAAIVLALCWVTHEVLSLAAAEAGAREEARVQEALRLALWRMDSAFAPVVAQESVRAATDYPSPTGGAGPVSAFAPFRLYFSIDAAGNASDPEVRRLASALVPHSEAAKQDAPQRELAPREEVKKDRGELAAPVKLETAEAGETSAKQAKPGAWKNGLERHAAPPTPDDGLVLRVGAARAPESRPGRRGGEVKRAALDKKVAALDAARDQAKDDRATDKSKAEPNSVAAAIAPPPAPRDASNPDNERDRDDEAPVVGFEKNVAEAPALAAPTPGGALPVQTFHVTSNRLPQVGQVEWSNDEFQSRARMTEQVIENLKAQVCTTGSLYNLGIPEPAHLDVVTTALEARWVATEELFFLRKVTDRTTQAVVIQGIWCDWKALESWLLAKAHDLFPSATLQPVADGAATPDGSRLASVPARFVPGPIEAATTAPRSPYFVMGAAWIAAIVAIASVGGVLRAAMSLGERRGRFVSAVTHELRTPLTTFRMYAQMLADGMVSKEAHAEYLGTLKDESERLARVVESVLLYSRLEEGRGGAHREVMRCDALLERALPIVRKRAKDGGMVPEIDSVTSEHARVEVDAQAVEQILLNLVDNAAKYAQPADPRLEVTCRMNGRMLEIACRDFGPGIPADESAAVFLAFRRGARDAAGTTPGVGLGLSLARGLARALGGDLVLEAANPGARFILTIPRV